MTPCGNYALIFDWSEGHTILYPYRKILGLMKDYIGQNSDDDDVMKKETRQGMKEEKDAML